MATQTLPMASLMAGADPNQQTGLAPFNPGAGTALATKDQLDATSDAPDTNAGPEAPTQQLSVDEQKALMKLRTDLKEANSQKRMGYIKRVVRAFETLKNNPYVIFGGVDAAVNSLQDLMAGSDTTKELKMYESNDNVYQMLALSFIAALSPDVPKTRYQPADADNEADILIAQKASTIQAYNERRNNIKALQKLELLYLWCTGSYFCYTRHIIDKNRAGIERKPEYGLLPTQVIPHRYVCPGCAEATPQDDMPDPSGGPCPNCSTPLGPQHWTEGLTLPVPQQTGYTEVAKGMTAMDIYSGLNVDADPDAKELYESLYLDLEGEQNIAWVRAQYPQMYEKIQAGDTGSTAQDGSAREARQMLSSPGAGGSGAASRYSGTYSRCWLQAESFNLLEDKALAQKFIGMFPDGMKLVTFNNDLFLQAVPERMTDKWTWCPTIKGLGLYPFGVGDVALDIQVRINNCANNVEAYMDRLVFGTLLADADAINVNQFAQKPLYPGNITPVYRDGDGDEGRKSLEELFYQVKTSIDSYIFEYGKDLIQLAQVLVGVQPQVFGGSDPNVQTKGGQEQALSTALGRMKLFWDQQREEHADRAQNSVRCSIQNMDEEMQIVQDGDSDGDWTQEVILQNELTGDFLAYPESDEGFPASYEEIKAQTMQLVEMASKGGFLQTLLSDPDTQKIVGTYVLPPGVKQPGEEARARLKTMVQMLSKDKATVVPGPDGNPLVMPSIQLNPKFDDAGMAVIIFKKWCNTNWKMAETNPDGFTNVLAALTLATQTMEMAQAQQALQQQAAAQGPGAPPALPAG